QATNWTPRRRLWWVSGLSRVVERCSAARVGSVSLQAGSWKGKEVSQEEVSMPTKRQLQDERMAQRLQDQLRVYKTVQAIRKNPRKLDEIAFDPVHDKQHETDKYKNVQQRKAIDQI